MRFAFGWAGNEWDRLAAGVVAGHINECGAQASGGKVYGMVDERQERMEGRLRHRMLGALLLGPLVGLIVGGMMVYLFAALAIESGERTSPFGGSTHMTLHAGFDAAETEIESFASASYDSILGRESAVDRTRSLRLLIAAAVHAAKEVERRGGSPWRSSALRPALAPPMRAWRGSPPLALG